MSTLRANRNTTLYGIIALSLLTVVAIVASVLYLNPPTKKMITFYTDDAVSIRPGDQVRIAGVNVGKVKDLALETDRVRVRAQVDGSVFIGDQSQVQVRMLTIVGGYTVNVASLGEKPLGSDSIPIERVMMPYNLMRILADSTKITEKVEAKSINESIDQLQSGFTDTNIESIGAVIDAGNTIMSTIERQQGQVSAILNLSDEYIQALSEFTDELRSIVRKVSILEQTLSIYGQLFGEWLLHMGYVVDQLAPIAAFYMNHRDKFISKVRNWLEKAQMWSERNGAIVRTLRLFHNKIERILDAQGAPSELLATDLCMPVPGSPC